MIEIFKRAAIANLRWWITQLECAEDLIEQSDEWMAWFNPMEVLR